MLRFVRSARRLYQKTQRLILRLATGQQAQAQAQAQLLTLAALSKHAYASLNDAGKDVEYTIYPPFGDDGHELFFEVREPYWSDVTALLDEFVR